MAITTNCSGCGKTLAVADEFAGRQARCPACGQIYTVPSPTNPSTSLPSTGSSSGLNPTALEPRRGLDDTTGYSDPAPLDLGSPTSTPAPSTPAPALGSNASTYGAVQYWMRAGNGAVYGPADQAMLSRWFSEGRVGADYQIRIGDQGHWQPASVFQSAVNSPTPTSMPATGVNPFAAPSAFTPGIATARTYEKGDQSGLVLAMGILAWIGGCPIFGIIAWVIGSQLITDMNAGLVDPSNRGMAQIGYYLGMVNVILAIACGGFMLLGIAISAMAG